MPIRSPIRSAYLGDLFAEDYAVDPPSYTGEQLATIPNEQLPTLTEMEARETPIQDDTYRGLRSTLYGLERGDLLYEGLKARTEGDLVRAAQLEQSAAGAAEAAQAFQSRVPSYDQVQGVGDAVDFLQSGFGQVGATLGPPLVSGIAGSIAGAAVGGPVGAAIGGFAGASIPAYKMEAGEQAATFYDDPYIRENVSAEDQLREVRRKGVENAALEALFPAVFGGRVVGRAARRIAGEALKTSPLRRTLAVGRETAIESGTELAQTLTGQAGHTRLNPNRDTTHDYIEQIDSIILGALGGSSVSLGTTVPGYAMEKLGQRAEQKADVALRDLGRAGAELQLRTITQMQQRGEAVGLDVPLKRSMMFDPVDEKDRAEFQELAREYQQKITAFGEDSPEVAEVVGRTEKFFYNKHPEWKVIQEGIMSREAINTGGGTNTLRLGSEGTPTQENPDINMLPDQPVAMFPESTEGAAKFTRQHVRKGEEQRQLLQWKRQGFIPEEGIDAAQPTPLGQWLEKRRAAPEEIQAEVNSMIRDIDRRLRPLEKQKTEKAKRQRAALEAEKEALQRAKTYGDYFKALDNYTVLEFPADVVQGRFTPQDAAQQQRSSQLLSGWNEEQKRRKTPRELQAERDQLDEEQGIRLQLKIGGQPRWVYRDDVIKHARNFFRNELKSFPDGPVRDEAALLMGVFADPRVKTVSIRNEDGTYTRITQENANLEDPRHRAALKLPPLERDKRRFKPQDPVYSNAPEDRVEADYDSRRTIVNEVPVDQAIKRVVGQLNALQQQKQSVEADDPVPRILAQRKIRAREFQLARLRELKKSGQATVRETIHDADFDITAYESPQGEEETYDMNAQLQKNIETEKLIAQRLRAEERLANAKPRSNAAREAEKTVKRLTNLLKRDFDEFGGALRDQTRVPVTAENPIIQPVSRGTRNVSRGTRSLTPRRPKAPTVVGESTATQPQPTANQERTEATPTLKKLFGKKQYETTVGRNGEFQVKVAAEFELYGHKFILHRPVRGQKNRWVVTHAETGLSTGHSDTTLDNAQRLAVSELKYAGKENLDRAIAEAKGEVTPVRESTATQPRPTANQGRTEAQKTASGNRKFTGKPKTIALIGTAGRKEDGAKLTKAHWEAMVADAAQRVRPEDTLVSGGAAWADHVAVRLFLDGKVKGLKLFLPSEVAWDHGWFAGPPKSAASAAQYYHEQFSKIIGTNSIRDILAAIKKGAEVSYEPSSQGYKAMFDRNKKVAAAADASLAYTFGENEAQPKDGGTLDTWNQIKADQKFHVPLGKLVTSVPRETALNIWAGNNENRDLSNLAPRPFWWGGRSNSEADGVSREYRSVEHAYQTNKSGKFDAETYNDPRWNRPFTKVQGRLPVDKHGSRLLMGKLMYASFKQNPEALQRLLDTGDAQFTHVNPTGKTDIWTTEFPKLLGEIREQFQEKPSTGRVSVESALAERNYGTVNAEVMAELQNKTLPQLKAMKISKESKIKTARGEGYKKTLRSELAAINQLIAEKTPQTNVPRETSNEAWREGLPEHTIDRNLKNKDGSKRLASVRDGKPVINPVETVQEFFDYFLGNVTGPTSKQKRKVLSALVREGWPLYKIRKLIDTAGKANRFLAFHELDHIANNDRDVYWKQGGDFLTPDKIAIETRASKIALDQLAAENANLKQSKQFDETPSSVFYGQLAKNLKEKGFRIQQDPDTGEVMVVDKNGKRLEQESDALKKSMQMDAEEVAAISTREDAERWLVRAFGPDMRNPDKLGWMRGEDMNFSAGDYNPLTDFMRLALNSHDPLSFAFHEGMHKFVKKLKETNPALYDRMVKAATAPHIVKQMKKLLYDMPSGYRAIDQLHFGINSEDAEIRANAQEEYVAYAFQLYAASRAAHGPTFNIQPSLKQTFRKIMESIARVLGVMTHARATEQIFDALYEGRVQRDGIGSLQKYNERTFQEYSGDVMKALKSSVPRLVSSPIIQLQQMTNARGQQIQAFKKLANLWHSEPRKGGEAGVLQRTMQLSGQYMNRWHKILQDHNATKEDLQAALQNFQAWRDPRNDFEREIQTFFNVMWKYQFTGPNAVKVLKVVDEETGDREWVTPSRVRNYFPRIWSVENILANEIEFREVMREESRGKLTDEQITNFIEMLQATNGTEAGSELQQYRADFSPYNAAINARVFDFINENNAHKFAKFQEQNMGKIMDRYIRQAVHRREHSRTFGHDGKAIKEIFQQAQREGATPEQIAYAEKVVKGMEGRLGTDKVSDLARELMVGSMSLVNFAVLPLALFSSMVDPLGVMVRTGSMKAAGKTFKAGFKQILNDARKVKTSDQELTEYLGIIEEDMVQDILNNLERGMYMNETLRRWNKFFFKSIGLEQWTRGTRIGAMRASLEYLKKNADNAEALAELGLEPGMIQEYEDRIALKPGEFQDGDQNEQARKVQNAVYRMVDEAILRPSAGTRPLWMSDMRFRLFGHLKSYTFTFHNQILRQVATQVKNADDMGKAALAIMPLLSYVPVMLAADMARDMVKGDDRDRDWDEVLGRALQRSAILGMGTFLMDIEDDMDYGGLPTNTLLGPVVDNALNLGRTAVNPEASFLNAGAKLLPYNALWRGWGDE